MQGILNIFHTFVQGLGPYCFTKMEAYEKSSYRTPE
jgi:hypothetical protein